MNLLNKMYIALMCRLNAIKTDESGGSEMIAVVVMIGIVVLLAVVFKDQIADLVSNIFDKTSTGVDNVMQPITT